ncbi:micronuclear linker histone polyprotein-like [Procambarus clarkii]|uniref:micronuclear linker histone polyprotein-like n=1 Tax=Procambarus clarkii TaxID=6728 RepID=UPI003742D561
MNRWTNNYYTQRSQGGVLEERYPRPLGTSSLSAVSHQRPFTEARSRSDAVSYLWVFRVVHLTAITLRSFIERQGIPVLNIQQVSHRESKYKSFLVTVKEEDASALLHRTFWPGLVSCRLWYNSADRWRGRPLTTRASRGPTTAHHRRERVSDTDELLDDDKRRQRGSGRRPSTTGTRQVVDDQLLRGSSRRPTGISKVVDDQFQRGSSRQPTGVNKVVDDHFQRGSSRRQAGTSKVVDDHFQRGSSRRPTGTSKVVDDQFQRGNSRQPTVTSKVVDDQFQRGNSRQPTVTSKVVDDQFQRGNSRRPTGKSKVIDDQFQRGNSRRPTGTSKVVDDQFQRGNNRRPTGTSKVVDDQFQRGNNRRPTGTSKVIDDQFQRGNNRRPTAIDRRQEVLPTASAHIPLHSDNNSRRREENDKQLHNNYYDIFRNDEKVNKDKSKVKTSNNLRVDGAKSGIRKTRTASSGRNTHQENRRHEGREAPAKGKHKAGSEGDERSPDHEKKNEKFELRKEPVKGKEKFEQKNKELGRDNPERSTSYRNQRNVDVEDVERSRRTAGRAVTGRAVTGRAVTGRAVTGRAVTGKRNVTKTKHVNSQNWNHGPRPRDAPRKNTSKRMTGNPKHSSTIAVINNEVNKGTEEPVQSYTNWLVPLSTLLILSSEEVVARLLGPHYDQLLTQNDISDDELFLGIKVLAHASRAKCSSVIMRRLLHKIWQPPIINLIKTFSVTVERRYPERAERYFWDLAEFLDAYITNDMSINGMPSLFSTCLSEVLALSYKSYVGDNLVKVYKKMQDQVAKSSK